MPLHTRMLPVRLTTVEKAACADEMARCAREQAEAEKKCKAVAKEQKEKVDELKARLGTLARIVETGEEPRPVNCSWERDNRAFVMREIRLDTGEEVDRRPMTEAEMADRQASLFDVSRADSKPTA